jgi:hypothetical protein
MHFIGKGSAAPSSVQRCVVFASALALLVRRETRLLYLSQQKIAKNQFFMLFLL